MTDALRTARLVLRQWRDDDAAAFAELSADPAVMQYLVPFADRAAMDAWVVAARTHWQDHGFGPWVVELRGEAPMIGVVGLSNLRFALPFAPAVEAAWRLARPNWGQGYAYEAARAAIADGFGRLGLNEIVAFTVPANLASRRVMEKLGMTRDPAEDFDFEHPRVPPGHPLRRHVLYRLQRS
ncbi:MAG: GNAT family N-acetyltransferase [Stellaceae bacterium]